MDKTAVLYFEVSLKDSGTPCGGLYQTFISPSERKEENMYVYREKEDKRKTIVEKIAFRR